MAATAKVVVSAQVDRHVRRQLELEAAAADRTLSSQIRRVLDAYVRRAAEPGEESRAA